MSRFANCLAGAVSRFQNKHCTVGCGYNLQAISTFFLSLLPICER
ncbi:hypothetical protein HMPREF9136_0171 [Prevotella dentalis DSM 3688]|uniref:Uncharacterized protein n=1 Tax=Prevotella dentalis (strain ATCC 49559 / DSM 3688 / JCM 13448 / NCTC 12043 / ES 2772) TaxID=908937 RepID=F9CZZ4_PREDD|nr:hypothetical protein HMPREF9136_0171 [Prevotella dentalis DSM 3688]